MHVYLQPASANHCFVGGISNDEICVRYLGRVGTVKPLYDIQKKAFAVPGDNLSNNSKKQQSNQL